MARPASARVMILIWLDGRCFRLPLATCRSCHIGDGEEQQQYQRHECFRAIVRKVVRNECRDPRECESGVSPLLEFRKTGDDKSNPAKRFGDPKNNAQLLWISDVCKTLNYLRTAR